MLQMSASLNLHCRHYARNSSSSDSMVMRLNASAPANSATHKSTECLMFRGSSGMPSIFCRCLALKKGILPRNVEIVERGTMASTLVVSAWMVAMASSSACGRFWGCRSRVGRARSELNGWRSDIRRGCRGVGVRRAMVAIASIKERGSSGDVSSEFEDDIMNSRNLVEVGYVVDTYGAQGELQVQSLADLPEEPFEKAGIMWVRTRSIVNLVYKRVELLKGRECPGRRRSWLIRLKGIKALDEASELIGSTILVNEKTPWKENGFYAPDLVGMTVALQDTGQAIGVVLDVFNMDGSTDFLQVSLRGSTSRTSNSKFWIPFVKDIVRVIDKHRNIVEITPTNGLLELNSSGGSKDVKVKLKQSEGINAVNNKLWSRVALDSKEPLMTDSSKSTENKGGQVYGTAIEHAASTIVTVERQLRGGKSGRHDGWKDDMTDKNLSDISKVVKSSSGGGSSSTVQQQGREVNEKKVEVEVEVVSWRERHIRANICVEASSQSTWDVLTDYERLAEFIPNLVRSERIMCPHPGRIWLLQQGMQRAMYWHIEARVLLELEEFAFGDEGKELRFAMVEGDFKRYEGRWYLRPGPRPGTTMLYYEVNVTPKLFFPGAFVERVIKADLPINLRALADRAETDISEWKNSEQPNNGSVKPTPSPLRSFWSKLSSANFTHNYSVEPIRAVLQFPFQVEKKKNETFLKVHDLHHRISKDGDTIGNPQEPKWGGLIKSYSAERPCSVDEVHLRRLDDLLENGGVHRRVVATITVESPIKHVWDVLTDYECLSEFIPNLASSKIISRENNRVRLVQEGCKCILYMVLHARVVLDLWEKPDNEIIFQQVEGDFDSFQGKWTLEPLGSQHTLLKYVVDTKMHKHCLLAEAIVEEVIYEDLPANLCAIRDRVEFRKQNQLRVRPHAGQEASTEIGDKKFVREFSTYLPGVAPKVGGKRFRVPGLQKDFRILERELLAFIEENGRVGIMPMRSELRQHKRVDLEKAITRMGGFSTIASRLNLCQQRRPRGYWDDFQNVRKEILQLQKERGMDPMYMPTRNALNKAGRPDVARALEKWGGVQEVARLLGLKVRRVGYRSPKKITSSEACTVVKEDYVPQKPFKISLPPKPTKWLDMKQELSVIDRTES